MKAEDLRPTELVNRDSKTQFPMTGPFRIMEMGIPTFAQLEKDLIRTLGWNKTSIIFNRLGYQWGLAQAHYLEQQYHFDSPEEWLKAGSLLRKINGLADEEITDINFEPETGRISFKGVWRESFEVLMVKSEAGLRPEPVCRILSGITSGFATAVFGVEMLVLETECQATGKRLCCFEGRPVEEWDQARMEVKQYFAVTYLDEELAHTANMIMQTQEELNRMRKHERDRISDIQKPNSVDGIIFRSQAMAKSLLLAEKVAPTASNVLIQGESGTGKEEIARFIHRHSGRIEEPFLAVNCAALPPNLLESELFGHKRGSFTGADADKKGLFVEAGKGTLFLDEVGEMPLEIQAKLLRAIQNKKVRPVGGVREMPVQARILAATNRDLMEMVASGKFREDLYYRLAVFPLKIDPLRDRREDILLLARFFLERQNKEHAGFSPEAVRRLESYSWPGNVRELENWVEYAVVLSGDERIKPEHLPVQASEECDPFEMLTTDMPTQEELERRYIEFVLKKTDGNKSEAARVLGLSPSTLWRRLKE